MCYRVRAEPDGKAGVPEPFFPELRIQNGHFYAFVAGWFSPRLPALLRTALLRAQLALALYSREKTDSFRKTKFCGRNILAGSSILFSGGTNGDVGQFGSAPTGRCSGHGRLGARVNPCQVQPIERKSSEGEILPWARLPFNPHRCDPLPARQARHNPFASDCGGD